MQKFLVSFLAVVFVCVSVSAFAVKPPSLDTRSKAEATKQKDDKKKTKEQRNSGCEYGKNEDTGKCYKPKEGQFYRDPKTGKVEVKKIEKINLPWNQGDKKQERVEKEKKKEAKKKK